MNVSLLKEQCKALKLGNVSQSYAALPYESKEQYLTAVFAAELSARREKRTRRLLKKAAFPQPKTLDTFDWQGVTFPAKTSREHLVNLEFIHPRENVILMGDVGLGKTHLATALGLGACVAGQAVRFFRTAEFANLLLERHARGTLGRFMRELQRSNLLILDELGFVPLHRHAAELVFNVVATCYEQRSIIVTTNLEFGQWNTVPADNRLTAALVDRLVHHAHVLAFTGESYRLRHALSELGEGGDGRPLTPAD